MDWVVWFGYLASFVVLISLAMSSIIRLRWINLAGCLLFAVYGYLIDAWPVVAMNLGIAAINSWYLYRLYHRKEAFTVVRANPASAYFKHFLGVNRSEIEKCISLDALEPADVAFYLLRDNNTAGIIVGRDAGDGVLEILLDYVTPKYRDFKLGCFFFEGPQQTLQRAGYTTVVASARKGDRRHRIYLKRMGFRRDPSRPERYIRTL